MRTRHCWRELSVRARSVLQLGRALRHFDRGACPDDSPALHLGLFDSARDAGLHRLGAWERELLEYTALLHHIGAFLTYTLTTRPTPTISSAMPICWALTRKKLP